MKRNITRTSCSACAPPATRILYAPRRWARRPPYNVHRFLCALAVVLVLAFSGDAFADDLWYAAYEKGIKALKSGDWKTAEEKLKLAVSKRSGGQERNVKTYGMNRLDYFPDYYLGVVYFNQRRYQEAAAQFAKAERQGLANEEKSLFAQLQNYQQQIDRADQQPQVQAQQKEPPAPTPAPPTQPSAAQLQEQQRKREAQELVTQANTLIEQNRLADARKTLQSAQQKDPANTALSQLADRIARKEEELRLKQQEQQAQQEAQGTAAKQQQFQTLVSQANQAITRNDFATARRVTAEAESLAVNASAINDLKRTIAVKETTSQVESAIARKDWKRAENALQRLSTADPQNGSIQQYRAAITKGLEGTQIDPAEQKAIVAFYSGEYEQAQKLLDQISGAKKESARVQFYLGCTTAALALMTSGKNQETLLQQASQYFAQVRRLNPRFAYDSRNISPRILQVYLNGKTPST